MEKLKKISIATAAICGLIIALSPHKTIPITNKKLQAISSLENIIDTNKTISINSIKLDSSDNFKELIKYNLWIDSTLNESKANNSNSIIVNKERRKLYLVKNGKICVRIPSNKKARQFIKKTGMLVSTSANISGQKPLNFKELKEKFPNLKHKSFGRASKPSTIIDLVNKKIIREGNRKIKCF